MEEPSDKSPEQDLREDDVEEDAHPGRVPDSDEHMLPDPVNLQRQSCASLTNLKKLTLL